MELEKIFKNPEIFSTDYIPNKFLFRDKEISEIENTIKANITLKKVVKNIHIWGPPSTGKTHIIKRIIERFKTLYGNKLYYVSGKENTLQRVMVQLIREYFNPDYPLRGYTVSDMKDDIIKYVKEEDIVGFVFDEIDRIYPTRAYKNPQDFLINMFSRINEDINKPKIFLIVISNKPSDEMYLQPSTISYFRPYNIYFHSYYPDEITEILWDRCQKGFYEGIISRESLSEFVAKSLWYRKHPFSYKGNISETADIRLGLKTLVDAGIYISQNNMDKIDFNILNLVLRNIEKNAYEQIVKNLDDLQLILLYVLHKLQLKSNIIRSADVYNEFERICKNMKIEIYSTRTMYACAERLEKLGLITSSVRGLGKGKGVTTVFKVSTQIDILDILEDELRKRAELL